MTAILITGGAGFIGLNFLEKMLKKDIQVINLDLLTYAANRLQLKELDHFENYTFIQGDIRDSELLNEIFRKHEIHDVIHFAAESHVDNSIAGPATFIETNIKGTFQLLEAARRHWMDAPFQYKNGYENCRFLHVSTDEVYGSLGAEGFFTEETPYAPNSPYSASKASSDMLVRSYHHTYGMNTVITNCSNNFGPYQHDEKLIPTVIRSALHHQLIPIYGDGQNVRDWLFVEDHCRALGVIFEKAEPGAHYNIGGNNEKNNLELVTEICRVLDQLIPSSRLSSYKELITFVNDRPGHDQRYAIDTAKLKRNLGWEPSANFEANLIYTVCWYINKYGFTAVR
ncbi:dTDP-glucose 4,6-dehydratase [Domibacillus iocasae]|uniref:dTDP-glucose 4,6-dehydratase n=1 Tax=Domibacillus iocasae TaxID=1714016 RepID=A0A1E7DSS1_9BACI|nr:dTDP-glucose 4,6-dehydratase [Domibacillus iocasae]OES46069.1 dTDP-glucose 4,6-dehydratase [Domibacillus iocasae]